jgi:Zn-dependent alcohol dehydrogenase
MRALCWHGKGNVRVDTVPDPKIQRPRDAIIKITACAICGSDLHLLDGYQPTMESGDILGHENMGEVIELRSEVTNLAVGDRVVVPFTISCGQCWFCQQGLYSCCDRTNPNAEMARKAMGQFARVASQHMAEAEQAGRRRSGHSFFDAQMKAGQRRAWRSDLAKNHKASLEAPSWLWASVVELLGLHYRVRVRPLRLDSAPD